MSDSEDNDVDLPTEEIEEINECVQTLSSATSTENAKSAAANSISDWVPSKTGDFRQFVAAARAGAISALVSALRAVNEPTSIFEISGALALLGSTNSKTASLVLDEADEITRVVRHHWGQLSSHADVSGALLGVFGLAMEFDSAAPFILDMFPLGLQRMCAAAEQTPVSEKTSWLLAGLVEMGHVAVRASDRLLKRKLLALCDSRVFDCLGKMIPCGENNVEFTATCFLCLLIGDDPDHPLTRHMFDSGLVVDFAVPMAKVCVSGETFSGTVYSGQYADFSILLPLSMQKRAIEELVAACPFADTCAQMCKIVENSGNMLSLRQGQASALKIMRNLAHHSSQMKQSVTDALMDVHLDRFALHEDAAIREAAARLQLQLTDEPQGGEDGELPAEVQARGKKAEALYRRALLGGVAKINWAKLVLLGEDRAGKTSVLAALAGDNYESKTESTHGVASACYRLAAGVWKEEQHANLHKELVAASVAEGMRGSGDEEPEEVETGVPEVEAASSAPKTGSPKAFNRRRGVESKPKKEMVGNIEDADDVQITDVPIDLIASALKADSKSLRVVCKDTAGQPRYYSMLARTLSKCSMPVIVFNLVRWAKHVLKSKAFEGSHVDLQLHCGSRATGDAEEEKTLGSELVFFRYWLSMILVRTQDAPIYVVGTRLDDIVKVTVGNQKLIRQLLQDLSKVIEEVAKSVGVLDRITVNTTGFGMDTLIFPVDNSFSIEENGVEVLQESLFETLSEEVETGFLSQEIPLLWVKLLDILRATATDRPLMTVAEIIRIAEHFELLDSTDESEHQVRSALEYFSDIGEICYFGDAGHALRHLVFVDPESLALAQANILDCPRAVKKMTSFSSELHEDGVLHDKLLHEIWRVLFKKLDKRQKRTGPQTQNEPIDRKQAFVGFLVSSDFLVPMTPGNTSQLWVPSVLPIWQPGPTTPSMLQMLQDDPPLEMSIFMDLKGISLPELFPRLVAGLLNSKGFDRVNKSVPKLYRNAAHVNTTSATLTAILRPPLDAKEVVICARQHNQEAGAAAPGVVFQSIVDILRKVVKNVSPSLSERIVIGPALMDGGCRVIASLQELTSNVNKGARTTHCEQLDGRMVQSDELPTWLHELMFPGPEAASVSGAGVHAVRNLRSEADGEKPESAADGEPSGGNASPAQDEELVEVEGLLQLCENASLSPNAKLMAAAWCQENEIANIGEILDDYEELIAYLGLKKHPERRLRQALQALREELEGESEDEGQGGVTATGDKFIVITFGDAQDAALGIEKILGLSEQDRIAGEAKGLDAIREDIQRSGSKEDRDNLKYILEGVAQKEEDLPPHVIKDYERGFYHGGKISRGDYDKDHGGMAFQNFMDDMRVIEAHLKDAEVCAIRLYSTNSYRLYNNPLRQKIKPHPIAMTVYFLVTGIKKLRAVSANQPGFTKEEELWRGLKDAKLADLDKFKAEGGTELAAMSTTKSLDVARAYSESRRPLLFKFTASGMSKGVPIDFLSTYPLEKEYLYPPGTYLCPRKQGKKHRGGLQMNLNVIDVEPQFPS